MYNIIQTVSERLKIKFYGNKVNKKNNNGKTVKGTIYYYYVPFDKLILIQHLWYTRGTACTDGLGSNNKFKIIELILYYCAWHM